MSHRCLFDRCIVGVGVTTRCNTMAPSTVAAFAGKSRKKIVHHAATLLIARKAFPPSIPVGAMSDFAFSAWMQDQRVRNDDKPLLSFIRKRTRVCRPPRLASIIKTALNNERFLRLLLTRVGEKPLQEAVAAMTHHVGDDDD